MIRHTRFIVPIVLTTLFLCACQLLELDNGVAATPSPEATAPFTVPPATPALPNPTPPPVVAAPLKVWIPPEIGARTVAGSQALADLIQVYQTAHPTTEIIVEQKPMDGPGGLMSYLLTGRLVAPTIMPDLVAVPNTVLADSRYRDIFFPLGGLLDGSFIDDIYPAPAGQVIANDQLYGYPFATTGLTHLIYDPSVITGTIPMSWTRLISDTEHTLVIPADSREGAMLGLQFYLAEGGALVDESGRAALETEALARALGTIAANKPNLLQSHQLKTLDEAWQYHQLGLSDFMWTRAEYLLGQGELDPAVLDELGLSVVPGPSVALIPLTTSWAWAVTTAEPARQARAASLIQFLTTPENLAIWSDQSHVLPAQREAMALLAEQSRYYQFAAVESERARALPVSETSRLMDVLGNAVFQALTTDTSAVLLAEEAALALRQ